MAASKDDGPAVEKFLLSIPEFAGTIVPGEEHQIWNWLFLSGGFGLTSSLIARDDQGAIVAHYGIAPIPYELDGQAARGGMICKLAVAEALRNSTLFMQLSTRLIRSCSESGTVLLQGLANRPGLESFHRAFGFKTVGKIPVYAKPLRFSALLSKLLPPLILSLLRPLISVADRLWRLLVTRSIGSDPSITIEEIHEFPADMPAFSGLLRSCHRYFAARSMEFLNYRFFSTPFRQYRVFLVKQNDSPVGYFVLRRMDIRGFDAMCLVDVCFDFDKKELGRRIFGFVDHQGLAANCAFVATLGGSARLRKYLSSARYFRSPEHFTFVVRSAGEWAGLGQTNIDDWYISWIEHDFV